MAPSVFRLVVCEPRFHYAILYVTGHKISGFGTKESGSSNDVIQKLSIQVMRNVMKNLSYPYRPSHATGDAT